MSSQELISLVAGCGFEGIDLSYRPKGHILPEHGRKALPEFVRLAGIAGLTVPMAVTAITEATTETAEYIRVMADNGIRYYRMGELKYDRSISVPANLERFRRLLGDLCELNSRVGIHGALQNHAGEIFGAAVWDLYMTIKDLDPRYIGCQYDIRHGMAEGMQSWVNPLRALAPHIKTICIKDFIWNDKGKNGMRPLDVPLGTGYVDFESFFAIVKATSISGPISLHFEYPLIAGNKETMTAHLNEVTGTVSNDLRRLKSYLAEG